MARARPVCPSRISRGFRGSEGRDPHTHGRKCQEFFTGVNRSQVRESEHKFREGVGGILRAFSLVELGFGINILNSGVHSHLEN